MPRKSIRSINLSQLAAGVRGLFQDCAHACRALVTSLILLGMLMLIAFYLGKSLEGFVPPLLVWLLLAANGFRRGCRSREPLS